jgi:hypothetical protein
VGAAAGVMQLPIHCSSQIHDYASPLFPYPKMNSCLLTRIIFFLVTITAVLTSATRICNWSEFQFTTLRPVPESMCHELCSSIWNPGQWIPFDQVHSDSCSDRITLCLDSQVPAITGPKDITLRVSHLFFCYAHTPPPHTVLLIPRFRC